MTHERHQHYDASGLDSMQRAMGSHAAESIVRAALARVSGQQGPALDAQQVALSSESRVRAVSAALRSR